MEPRAHRYEMLELLGRGGFGTVYRARQSGGAGGERVVAVKVLKDAVTGNTLALARMRDEARILSQLRHPSIIRVDGVKRLSGRHAVVMEHVAGASVQHILDVHGRMPLPAALEVIAAVASALHAAWLSPNPDGDPMHLIHRDLKPSNIQISETGAVKLLDFGIARADVERESHSGSIVYGSVPYMAPERMRQLDSHKADVYSLGVCLLEMLSSRLPGEPALDAKRHGMRVAQGLDVLGQHCDNTEVEALVKACLAWDAHDRPDADEVARRCTEIRGTLDDPGLAAWASRVVPACVSTVAAETDELVGRTLLEEIDTEAIGTLSDLLTDVPSTFDQPELGDLIARDDPVPAPTDAGGSTLGRRLAQGLVAVGGLGFVAAVATGLLVLCAGILGILATL